MDAGVEDVRILQHLVVEIVLGGQPQRTRLDAHVDVFGHQDDLPLRLLPLQRHDHAEAGPVDDGVVLAHFGVGTNRPVGRNSRVRIRTTNETITACAGLTQIEA